jgi:hypothetical protein
MRAIVPFGVPFGLSALVLAALSPLVLAACDQDYAASDANRHTFMGDTTEVLGASAADASRSPMAPMAPPQMGALPPPAPQAAAGDAGTDAAGGARVAATPAPRPAPILR